VDRYAIANRGVTFSGFALTRSPGRSECLAYPLFWGDCHDLCTPATSSQSQSYASPCRGRVEARAERFDESDIRGDYAFTFDGSAGPVPIAAVGRFYGDGKGNLLNGSRTLVAGGTVLEQTFNCTCVVWGDGRGAANCQVIGADPESFSFVLFKHGQETYFVGTTPGIVVHGSAVKQR
jgi:hypothetical protein